MTSIGSYEAKTKFAELIERAAEGEAFIITRHGKPAAKLCPIGERDQASCLAAIETLEALCAHASLGVDLQGAKNGGRR